MQMHHQPQPSGRPERSERSAPQAWRRPVREAAAMAQTQSKQVIPAHDAWTALSAVLSAQRPIAYSVNLARVTGDIKAALFLSQLLYWTRVGVHVETHDGWIFKTREQWTLETGLSRFEQQSVRSKLCTIGLMEQARIGSPARNCYRVVPQALGLALARLLKSEPVQWTLFDIRSNAQQLKALLGRNLAFYRAFSDITTSMTAAVFLTKALSVQRNVAKVQSGRMAAGSSPSLLPEHQVPWESEWFHLSHQQWNDETGLTASQQKDGKQKLCQHDLLEEAFQTHPKRRTYLRVNVSKLSQALNQHLQTKVNAGGAATGLMGVILKGLGQQANREGLDSLSNCITTIHLSSCTESVQLDKTANITRKTGVVPFIGSIPAENENLPICFALSANPVGEFSPASLSVSTGSSVSFGGLHGSVFADPHAGAVLTTNMTTTTTTSGLAKRVGFKKIRPVDNLAPVVVVSENLNAKTESQSQLIVWSKQLAIGQVDACNRLLSMGSVPTVVRQQALADELAGHLKSGRVRNPIAYLRSLVETDRRQDWNMLLEHADDVAAIRLGQAAHAARLAVPVPPPVTIADAAQASALPLALSAKASTSSSSSPSTPSAVPLAASDIAKEHLAKIRALRDAMASNSGKGRRVASAQPLPQAQAQAQAQQPIEAQGNAPMLANLLANSNRFTASPFLRGTATDGVSGGRSLGVKRFLSRGDATADSQSNPQ